MTDPGKQIQSALTPADWAHINGRLIAIETILVSALRLHPDPTSLQELLKLQVEKIETNALFSSHPESGPESPHSESVQHIRRLARTIWGADALPQKTDP